MINKYIKEKSAKNPKFKRAVEEQNQRMDAAIAVHHLREELGLSQRGLADLVGKPQSTIARIELGSINVSIDTLRAIGKKVNKRLVIKFE